MLVLKKIIYSLISKIFNFFGYKLVKKELFSLIDIEKFKSPNQKIIKENFISYIFMNKEKSKSQIFQDLFVDFILRKKKGIFCEIGAADGYNLSNTYYLEKNLSWRGVLCEPSLHWRKKLKKNRNKCKLVFDAIDANCGTKIFYESNSSFLSGFKNKTKKHYYVKTIDLNTLFKKNRIKKIDYLSIDTEGSEYDIISNLNFSTYRPKVITIEHNYTKNKNKIHKFLLEKNYKLLFPYFSRFDSFFVCKKVLKKRI